LILLNPTILAAGRDNIPNPSPSRGGTEPLYLPSRYFPHLRYFFYPAVSTSHNVFCSVDHLLPPSPRCVILLPSPQTMASCITTNHCTLSIVTFYARHNTRLHLFSVIALFLYPLRLLATLLLSLKLTSNSTHYPPTFPRTEIHRLSVPTV